MTRTTAPRTTPRLYVLSLLLVVSSIHEGSLYHVKAFVPTSIEQRRSVPPVPETDTWRKPYGFTTTVLNDSKLDREIEENSRRKAQGGGGGEVAAGAILGGLLGGPFGK
jgi:hypothetical protein